MVDSRTSSLQCHSSGRIFFSLHFAATHVFNKYTLRPPKLNLQLTVLIRGLVLTGPRGLRSCESADDRRLAYIKAKTPHASIYCGFVVQHAVVLCSAAS